MWAIQRRQRAGRVISPGMDPFRPARSRWTVRSAAARERKNTPSVLGLRSAPLSTIGSDLTYCDLSWNTRRSAGMSLPAKRTCLPHCVAIGFADGIAIAVSQVSSILEIVWNPVQSEVFKYFWSLNHELDASLPDLHRTWSSTPRRPARVRQQR